MPIRRIRYWMCLHARGSRRACTKFTDSEAQSFCASHASHAQMITGTATSQCKWEL